MIRQIIKIDEEKYLDPHILKCKNNKEKKKKKRKNQNID